MLRGLNIERLSATMGIDEKENDLSPAQAEELSFAMIQDGPSATKQTKPDREHYGTEDNSGADILLLTNPRVYSLQGDEVLIVSQESRLLYNTQTRAKTPVDIQLGSQAAPIFQQEGNVIVDSPSGGIDYGFRRFVPVYQLGQTGFFREDHDPMRRLRGILSAAQDINSWYDHFDWLDGHWAFRGEGIFDAIEILLPQLSGNGSEASILSARSLKELYLHVSHGCFTPAALALLCACANRLHQAMGKEQDPDVCAEMKQALQEFERYPSKQWQ
jgi:hypothetical protein